ncbi:MAG: hypothetical protein SF162_10090 [bacterium]|nr:hypothetical protein [bacterium]
MQPGLSRAVPMAILGFLLGSLLVVVLRFLQSLDPVWAVGPGIVISAITTAIFFVWGMGGFDPKMSAHGEEAADHGDAHHADEAEALDNAPPSKILSSTIWTLTTLLLVTVGLVWAFALIPGGFTLITTDDPNASLVQVGYIQAEVFGRSLQISQLVVFLVFIIITMGSLAVIGAGIAGFFMWVSRGLAENKVPAGAGAVGSAPLLTGPESAVVTANPNAIPIEIPGFVRQIIAASVTFTVVSLLFFLILLPAAISHAPEWITPLSILMGVLAVIFVVRPAFVTRLAQTWALILFIFLILYFIFYEVAIGLVIAQPYALRVLVSLVNAFLFAVLLVRASWVVWFVGASARVTLTILRALPRVLFQR